MGRQSWALIKQSRSFNIIIFRKGLSFLLVSLVLSTLLVLSIFYVYITEPERDYYATSGITPPVKLKALLERNMSSNALLDPDPPADNEQKIIPQ